MNRMIALLSLTAAVLAGTVAIFAQDDKDPPERQSLELTVNKVKPLGELKAELNSDWKDLPALTVDTRKSPKTAGPQVEIRALHDGEFIYVMARWRDETKSTTKKGWVWTEGKWTQSKGDEDRIALVINGNVAEFAEKGCAMLCHYGDMGTGLEGETADLWHWKAARGGLNGVADDQHFNLAPEGRQDDEGTSGYAANTNEAKDAPKWIWKEDADQQGAFTEETSQELAAEFKPADGYSVPSNRLRKPEKSRADVTSAAEHKDGWWTVILKRKLDTGNKDDVVIKAGTDAHIAVAVFDNTGAKTGKEHAKSAAIKLKLKP